MGSILGSVCPPPAATGWRPPLTRKPRPLCEENHSVSEPVSELVDVAVIGAGVTGLAAAAELCRSGLSVCVVERHPRAGMETSTHNSGVIHAGIYYPAGSLKAELCVEGARAPVRVLRGARRAARPLRQVHRRVRRRRRSATLEALARRGTANGVRGLEMVDLAFLQQREPHVFAQRRALVARQPDESRRRRSCARCSASWTRTTRSCSAGRVSSRARPAAHGFDLRLERETIAARTVVNAAGLYADDVSRRARRRGVHDLSRAAASTRSCARRGDRWVNGLGVSAAARLRARPRRAPHEDDRRRRAARPDGAIPGGQGRLRARPSSRSRISSSRRGSCCRR